MQLKFTKILLVVFIVCCCKNIFAQETIQVDDAFTPTSKQGKFANKGAINNSFIGKKNGDTTFQHRDDAADSIAISFRKFNQLKTNFLDSTINNINTRLPLPYYYNNMGNIGTAAQSLLFNPILTTGFGAGFHQFDIYNYTVENTKLFETTKPYTELAYLLGSKAEQQINVLHTQNKTSNLNFSLEYRFINAPGVLKNQNASLNNTRFVLHYQSPNKRYHLLTMFIANKNAASENGGAANIKQLDSLALNDPFEITMRLGLGSLIRQSPFSTTVNTGNIYKQTQFFVQHQYDLGQKDSIVKDSTITKLFYPRLRLQHQLSIKKNEFGFSDIYADSTNYQNYFNYTIKGNKTGRYDTIAFKDSWSIIDNDFSIISYPDKKNAAQYIKANATIQSITGTFNEIRKEKLYNIFVGGEYKNRTKNKIWDVEAAAQFYVSGYNIGDYNVAISLQKLVSKKTSSLQIGFQNINKTPEFIYNASSSFLVTNRTNYNKENTTKFWGVYTNNKLNLQVTGEYFLLSNFLYFDSFFKAQQEATLFNVLHIGVEKKFKLTKYFNLYSQIHLQQTTANAPVNIPAILTNNRIVFEGNFYKNLFLATGLELRFHSNYKPSGYSPFNGQFYYQNNYTTSNKPDINFFFNFKIKTFKAYLRVENLNTFLGTGSKKYNYSVEQYPNQGLWMHFGVWWTFIN